MPPPSSLMIQGCTSNAGKSLIVTALCRIARNNGIRVAPFKPQNMANNAAVTASGGEIGRAQALQAIAAGLDSHTDFNPVLLKPSGEVGSQVIINGKVVANMSAREYLDYRPTAFKAVLDAHERLTTQYDLILIEGAGSPAEINLRQHDIANMGFAEAINCPVWLVGNIDHGGVFAHLYGTHALLAPSEQNRITTFLINGFRGDASLLDPAIKWLEETTTIPVGGVIPMIPNLIIDAEDSLNIPSNSTAGEFKVVIPLIGRVSNHNDFDPLVAHPDIKVTWARPGAPLPQADLIILPGSKTTIQDIQAFKSQGWDDDVRRHLRYGGRVLGICGGYQMLGSTINDPHGIEGDTPRCEGLALLPITTTITSAKALKRVNGILSNGAPFEGYEMHCGQTQIDGALPSFALIDTGREKITDGCISHDGRIAGTYIHGVFENASACTAILKWAGLTPTTTNSYSEIRDRAIDTVAEVVWDALSTDARKQLLG